METPRRTFNRLLTALDQLVTQETATLVTRDYEAVGELQRRADPLVTTLAALGVGMADAMARARMASLLSRRQHNIDFIESQLAIVREEMHAVQESAGRIARIAPVYGRAEGIAVSPRLNAAG